MNDNICVSCGGYAPEGHMLCYNCRMESDPNRKMTLKVNVKIDWFSKVHEFVKLATLCPEKCIWLAMIIECRVSR